MSKAVTHAVESAKTRTFGMDKDVLRIACDDGTTYEFERELGTPRWRAVARYDRDGQRTVEPTRLPATVKAHMDGRTLSGPYGDDSKHYWV